MKAKPKILEINLLVPDPNNPREITPESVQLLSLSVEKFGILQPIIVIPHKGGKFMIKAGHRRWNAAKLAGLKNVPTRIVEEAGDLEDEIAIQENFHRENLTVLEEMREFHNLHSDGRSVEELAELAGRSVTYVRQRIAIQELDPKILDALRDGEIKLGHALALTAIPDLQAQRGWLIKIKSYGMDVAAFRNQLAGWRHDEFSFSAGSVTVCKSCREPEPSLFEDEEDATCSTCFNEKHLLKEDDGYRERVNVWAATEGIEIIDNPHAYVPGIGEPIQGEPPFKLPKGTNQLVRMVKNRNGEYVTTGWSPSKKATRTASTGQSAGSPGASREIEAGRRRAAEQAAQRHLTDQITHAKTLAGKKLTVARSKPQVLAFSLFQLMDHGSRSAVREGLNIDETELEIYSGVDDFYQYVIGLDDSQAWNVVLVELKVVLLEQSIPVMTDALARYLDVDPLATYEAAEEDLKAMRKDEVRSIITEEHIEEFPKSWSKGKHLDILTGSTLKDIAWPELLERLSERMEGEKAK